MEDQVRKVVQCAIDRLNELLPVGEPLPKEESTLLLGQGGKLDSMGFVNFLVALEEELEQQMGIKVSFADELLESGDGIDSVGDVQKLLVRLANDRKQSGGSAFTGQPNKR